MVTFYFPYLNEIPSDVTLKNSNFFSKILHAMIFLVLRLRENILPQSLLCHIKSYKDANPNSQYVILYPTRYHYNGKTKIIIEVKS